MSEDSPRQTGRAAKVRIGVLALLLIGVLVAAIAAPREAWMEILREQEAWRGPSGIATFVSLYVGWNFALPPAPLQAFAGAQYGFVGGLAVILVGTTVANIVSHTATRWLGRSWVEARVARSDRLAAMESAISALGWKGVVLLRLSNLVPSNMANLLLGLTSLRLPTILWASILGSLPGWVLMLVLGHGGAALLVDDHMSGMEWALVIGVAISTLVLLGALTVYARAALEADP